MHKFIFIPFCLLLFFFGTSLYAQNSIIDSTEQIVEAPLEDEVVVSSKELDTALYFQDHVMSADSIISWRNSKAFAYTKYLDSLLKIKEQSTTAKSSSPKNKKSPAPSPSPSQPGSPSRNYPSGTNSLDSPVLSIILWILAGAFVLFILYKLFLSESIFKKKNKTIKAEQEQNAEAEEELVNSESDFQRLIRLAVSAGNYRLAVRYQYLQSLHLLAGRNYLEMAVDKTNYQYVQEIKRHEVRNDFAALTLNYEYVWYGEFQVEDAIYHKLDTLFSVFNKKI